jgi:hypothetical protein
MHANPALHVCQVVVHAAAVGTWYSARNQCHSVVTPSVRLSQACLASDIVFEGLRPNHIPAGLSCLQLPKPGGFPLRIGVIGGERRWCLPMHLLVKWGVVQTLKWSGQCNACMAVLSPSSPRLFHAMVTPLRSFHGLVALLLPVSRPHHFHA